jgi:hypothetical protein
VYSIVIAALNTAAVMGCLSSWRLLYDKGACSVLKKSSAYLRQCTVPNISVAALAVVTEQRIITFSQLTTELLS